MEFDSTEGLTFTVINEAKSAFSSFSWEPAFFEKCSTPPITNRKRRQEDEDDDDFVFSCRVPLRSMAAVVKPRRHVLSLRVYSEINNDSHYLTFEFKIQKTGLLTVVHRMAVAEDSNRIVATMPKEGASELVVNPKVLLKMLDPLHKKSPEVAFIINDEYKVRERCVLWLLNVR